MGPVGIREGPKRGIGRKMAGQAAQPQIFIWRKLRKNDKLHWQYIYMYIINPVGSFFNDIGGILGRFSAKFFPEEGSQLPGEAVCGVYTNFRKTGVYSNSSASSKNMTKF